MRGNRVGSSSPPTETNKRDTDLGSVGQAPAFPSLRTVTSDGRRRARRGREGGGGEGVAKRRPLHIYLAGRQFDDEALTSVSL